MFVDWQKGNVSNQRENIVNLLSNEQSRLGTPDEHEPVSFFARVNSLQPSLFINGVFVIKWTFILF